LGGKTISAFFEAAQDYLANGFQPLPVQTKTGIPKGATGRDGTITPQKVAAWLKDEKFAEANIGIRAEGWIAIDVDHYNGKHGADNLKALEAIYGPLPVTISSTARGQDSESRQYFFVAPKGFESISRLSADIEIIQHGHRYSVVAPSFHPTTGSQYEWFDGDNEPMWGIPNVNEFEHLPEAWLQFMEKDAAAEHAGYPGNIADWLLTLPQGNPTEAVTEAVNNMPTDKFNHDDVLRVTFHLIRLGAEGQTGVEWALKMVEQTWVKPPYDTLEYRAELHVAIEGAIRRGGATEWPETLTKKEVADLVDKYTGLEKHFFDTAKKSLEVRKELVQAMHSQGATLQETMSAVWFSNQNVADHIHEVWEEVLAFEPKEPTLGEGVEGTLITEQERSRLEFVPNFVDRYQYIAGLNQETPNLPYYRADAWTLLSLAFGNIGTVPKKGTPGGMNVNLYVLKMGPSTSGKGQSKGMLRTAAAHVLGDKWGSTDIGGDPSPEAIHQKMLDQDGEPTFFNLDEGDQLFERMSQKGGYSTGLQQKITDWYDGHVGGRLRIGDESTGKSAKAYLVVWLMGVPEKIMGSLTRGQVEDGFIARFIPFFGGDRKVTRESLMTEEQDDSEVSLGYDPFVRELAEELKMTVVGLRQSRRMGLSLPIRQSEEAKLRLSQARHDLIQLHKGHDLASMVEPSMLRVADSMWKAAALSAMSRGSVIIQLDDVLVAARAAEEWVANLITMMRGVAANDWTAQLDRVFLFVKEKGAVSKPVLYRKFADMGFVLDNVTKSLENQSLMRLNKEKKWELIE